MSDSTRSRKSASGMVVWSVTPRVSSRPFR
jgi:hypothetical protein